MAGKCRSTGVSGGRDFASRSPPGCRSRSDWGLAGRQPCGIRTPSAANPARVRRLRLRPRQRSWVGKLAVCGCCLRLAPALPYLSAVRSTTVPSIFGPDNSTGDTSMGYQLEANLATDPPSSVPTRTQTVRSIALAGGLLWTVLALLTGMSAHAQAGCPTDNFPTPTATSRQHGLPVTESLGVLHFDQPDRRE